MQAVLTLSEAGEMDRRLIERYGLSSSALIDNAAKGAFEIVKGRVSGRIVVMAGPGNNGSDGIELARLLHSDGHDVSMLYPYEKGNEESDHTLLLNTAFSRADCPDTADRDPVQSAERFILHGCVHALRSRCRQGVIRVPAFPETARPRCSGSVMIPVFPVVLT